MNSEKNNLRFWIGIGCLVAFYLVIGLNVLSVFPALGIDEVNGIVGARSFYRGDAYHNFLVNDVIPDEAKFFLQNTASVGRPLYLIWLGLGMALMPSGWIAARIVSLLTGAFLMLFIALTGRRLRGTHFGYLSAILLLLSPPFWIASTVVNELIIMACFTSFLIWFLTTKAIESDWGLFIFGTLSPLLVLIHPFGAAITCVIWLLAVLTRRPLFGKKIPIVMGLVVGTMLVIIGAPWEIKFQNPFYFALAQPMVSRHMSLSDWKQHIAGFFTSVTSFYYPGAERTIWGLRESTSYLWLATGIAALRPPTSDYHRALVISFALLVFAFISCVARLEAAYGVLLCPFAVPLMTYAIADGPHRRPVPWFILKGFVVVLCLASSFAYWSFARRYLPTYRAHEEIARNVKNMTGPDVKRVMAPGVFLFDFPSSDFRDVSALTSSLFFTDGKFEPKIWLQHWHPDIIVANAGLVKFLSRWGDPGHVMASLLGVPIDVRGTVHTGTLDGDLSVLHLDWQAEQNHGRN